LKLIIRISLSKGANRGMRRPLRNFLHPCHLYLNYVLTGRDPYVLSIIKSNKRKAGRKKKGIKGREKGKEGKDGEEGDINIELV